MEDVLSSLEMWQAEGERIALATVVKVIGSAPRGEGSRMAITASGKMAGSVSGGCVEGAVFEEAQRAIRTGRPRLIRFGIGDEQAWDVGLACGGTIEVFVEPCTPGLCEILKKFVTAGQSIALATVVGGDGVGRRLLVDLTGEVTGSLGSPELDLRATRDAQALLKREASTTLTYDDLGLEVFFDVHPARPKLVIVGAVHVAIPLTHFARQLGFKVTVVDARAVFATPERFAEADELIVDWPDQALARLALDSQTWVVVLTHDEKLDDPALMAALTSPVPYIGALGSDKTHARRVARLKAEGITDAQLSRIHAPIGLDIGGRTPEEIAISILAQIIAVRNHIAGQSSEGTLELSHAA